MKKIFAFLLVLLALLVAGACSREKMPAPLVGISCGRSSGGVDQLSSQYTQAVSRAGGVPVIIPTVSTQEEARKVLSRVDGVIFSGGADIDPAWYGESIWNETVEIDPVRDRSDSLLAVEALRQGKRILGICRGEQLLNVILGGSLYQDIPTQVEKAHTHRGVYHMIGVEEGSFLADIFGTDSLRVNSRHHQAVKGLAPGLKAAAFSDDGLLEAYENEQVWAVQFHPETLVQEDDKWLPLFEAFLERIKE